MSRSSPRRARSLRPAASTEILTDAQGVAELIIAKQRNGPTGVVKLAFIREFTRFENLAGGGA